MIELLDCESVPESLESVNETPETVSESPESVNISSESVPESTDPEEMEQDEPSSSDWKNASGDEEHPEKLEKCEQFFCPFYSTDCAHSCNQSEFENHPDMVCDAVESEGCQNPDLLKIYSMISKEDINNE